ncbi:MAG TPA: class F sortase [Pseudonocardia sp.]|nr:class F sortase [Pseudonocardia sp.]
MAVAVAVCTLALTGGCAAAGSPSAAAPSPVPVLSTVTPAPAAVGVLPASPPQRLVIPSISVDTGLIDLGLQPDGTMEVPADGSTAGWYVHSPTPGERGPAVLAAHVDWQGDKGVFYDLRRTEPGDPIRVLRADGSTAAFTVQRVERYPKDDFPTEKVYGDVDSAQLRLITCGGEFDSAARSYRDNVVVYAVLTG